MSGDEEKIEVSQVEGETVATVETVETEPVASSEGPSVSEETVMPAVAAETSETAASGDAVSVGSGDEASASDGAAAAPVAISNKPKEVRIPLPSSLQEIVGSLLFASPQPLTATDLRTTIRSVEPQEGDDASIIEIYRTCTNREIEQALHGLEKELERSGVGFHLVCAGGQYRLQTNPTCGRYVRALLHLDKPSRLGRASLETLAIIAYRQPITKSEIEEIRGVAVDSIVKTLVDLQLVRLVGKSELPGHPFLYGTTPQFLEHFGLASLSELNAIDPTLQRSNPRERAKLFQKKEKTVDKETAPELPIQEEVKKDEEVSDVVPNQEAPVAVDASEPVDIIVDDGVRSEEADDQ